MQSAVETLRKNGVLLVNQEDSIVFLCNATSNSSIEFVASVLKEHRLQHSMLVFFNSVAMMERYVFNFPEIAADVIDVSDTSVIIEFDELRNIANSQCKTVAPNCCLVPCNAELGVFLDRIRQPVLGVCLTCTTKDSERYSLLLANENVQQFSLNNLTQEFTSKKIKFCARGTCTVIQ